MASKNSRPKFGTNFKKTSNVGSAPTQDILGINKMSKDAQEKLKEKFQKTAANTKKEVQVDTNVVDMLPNKNYTIKAIAIKDLVAAPDDWNFFTKPSENKIVMLAESIYVNGLLQPIVVRVIEDNKYQILSGHSRVQAYTTLKKIFQDNKYDMIEAMVFEKDILTDAQAEDIICDTNFMQRGTLSPMEAAKCVFLKTKRIKENKPAYGDGSVADKIAAQYKIKRSTVFRWKKLAKMLPELGQLIEEKHISLNNAYRLSDLDLTQQQEIYDKAKDYINNNSIKAINHRDNIETIIEKLKTFSDKTLKSFRYSIPETAIKNKTDKPLLLFADQEHYDEIMKAIKQITGVYIPKDI